MLLAGWVTAAPAAPLAANKARGSEPPFAYWSWLPACCHRQLSLWISLACVGEGMPGCLFVSASLLRGTLRKLRAGPWLPAVYYRNHVKRHLFSLLFFWRGWEMAVILEALFTFPSCAGEEECCSQGATSDSGGEPGPCSREDFLNDPGLEVSAVEICIPLKISHMSG